MALVSLCTVVANFAIMRFSVAALTEGQRQMQLTLAEISKAVALLTTGAAVSDAQQGELSRRISGVENALGEHSEQIRVLRTKVHMNSCKIMEIDPKWKPYQSEE